MDTVVKIGVVGDYDPNFRPHTATAEALRHAANRLNVEADVEWLPTAPLEQKSDERLREFDALWCAPGSPYQSMDGALNAIRLARQGGWPFLGTCGGFQHVVIEYARHVLGFADAEHAEYDPYASNLFVSELTCSLAGKTMRVHIEPDSRAARMYGGTEAEEQYYCNFGLNPEHQHLIHNGGLRVVGADQDGEARILELPEHRFFLATLFVPQLTSSEEKPHPLITAYVRAAAEFKEVRPVKSVRGAA
jgi:CTP synthase (UTP-ammonia lyase)